MKNSRLSLFRDLWRTASLSLPDAIKAVTDGMSDWKGRVFGNILLKKRELVRRISGIHRSWKYGEWQQLDLLEKELLVEYQRILEQ